MYYLELFILFLTMTCVLFLIIGLIRPWSMLWWEDVHPVYCSPCFEQERAVVAS